MSDAWRNIDQFLTAHGVRYGPPLVSQTTGGKHKPNSLHYDGRARDYGVSNSDLPAVMLMLRPYAIGPDHIIEELFGLSLYIDSGKIFAPTKALYASHQDHVHVGLRAGRLLPIPEKVPMPADNPDLPNIEGPLSFHPIADDLGNVVGYYIFSVSTGELHAHPHPDHPGKVVYLSRSEDLTPD
jgi:hypothetical protein